MSAVSEVPVGAATFLTFLSESIGVNWVEFCLGKVVRFSKSAVLFSSHPERPSASVKHEGRGLELHLSTALS